MILRILRNNFPWKNVDIKRDTYRVYFINIISIEFIKSSRIYIIIRKLYENNSNWKYILNYSIFLETIIRNIFPINSDTSNQSHFTTVFEQF